MTKRDMKNPKLGLCRRRLEISFYDNILVNTNVLLTKHAKIFVEGNKWAKKRHFLRGVESGGGFTSNRFVSMIRCSKHF